MLHFSLDSIRGRVINEGTVHQRRIKLAASPVSPARRAEYGCGVAIIPPGHIHEEHAHAESEELILVVRGSGAGRVGGQEILLRPLDFIAIGRGEAHWFQNTGDEELLLYWIYSPSGPEVRFLDDSPGETGS